VNSFEKKRKEMAAQATIGLSAGNLKIELSPWIGGSISAFRWIADGSSQPILRECNTPLENVLEASCFPLVPYVNRIRGGEFRFRERWVRLAPNMPGDPSPLHGQGWLNLWEIEECDEARATLAYRHDADEWPWDYEARQHFALDERGLTLTLDCHNASDEPMPCGLGLHPYFPCGPETSLDTRVRDVWTVDENVLPRDRIPATGRYDLGDRLICGQGLDNGFSDWNGDARMSDPTWPFELHLASAEARFFQVYSPPQGRIFVAEPVTHANAALNAPESEWPELGMRVLGPGEEMSLTMRLEVRPG
jgi:aldose 1-epimerase